MRTSNAKALSLIPICLAFVLIAFCVSPEVATAQQKPNIILINLDDADIELMSRTNVSNRYPNLKRFVDEGIQFTNFHVTTPLCGPSRACLLRGQYAHNTGIVCNDPNSFRSNGFNGGMQFYHDQGYLENDLRIWMKNAGYRTMHVGKFLHHETMAIVPPGWDDFYHYMGSNYFGAYRFTNETFSLGFGAHQPIDSYRTELETQDCVKIIGEHAARDNGQPFFLYLNPLAPHVESPQTRELGMVAPKYQHWWDTMRMPRTQSINEREISDKTSVIQHIPQLSNFLNEFIDQRYRNGALSMLSVDDMFRDIYQAVAEAGQLDNTYFILTSDNGLEIGHRRLFGKSNAYNQSTNVPCFVIGPNVPQGAQANHLLAHIDLAPTIVDMAGGNVPELVDGKSFRSLITNPTSVPEPDWRDAVLIENWESNLIQGGLMLHSGSNSLRFYDSS